MPQTLSLHVDLSDEPTPAAQLNKTLAALRLVQPDSFEPRLRSFHLEMVAQNAFSSLGSDLRDATMKFFSWAPSHLNVADPTSGESLGNRLTVQQRHDILASFTTAENRATKAANFERAGDHASAIGQWKLVFGNEFPSYTYL